jgi:hypothetical protein
MKCCTPMQANQAGVKALRRSRRQLLCGNTLQRVFLNREHVSRYGAPDGNDDATPDMRSPEKLTHVR